MNTRKNGMFTGKQFPLSRHLALAALTGFALVSLCSPVFAADGSIRAIQYDPNTRHFTIDATGPVRAIVNTLTIAGHKRIIIDIDNAEIGMELPRDSQLLQQLSSQFQGLRNVTVNQYGGSGGRPIVRILLDIESDLQTVRMIRNQGPRLELEVNESATARTTSPFPPQSYMNPGQVSAIQQPVQQPATRSQPATRVPATASAGPSESELKTTILQLSQKYDALYQENQYLKSQMATPKRPAADDREMNSLRGEIDRLKSSNANLQTQLDGLLTSSGSNDRMMSDLQRKLSETQQRVDSLSRENSSLKAQASAKSQPDPALSMQQEEINRLKRSNQDLQSQLEQAKSQTASSGPSVEAMKQTMVRMNQQYEALKAENDKLRSQQGTAATSVSDADLQALRGKLGMAQQSLNESIKTINEQNKEIAYLRNQVTDLKAGMDATSRDQLTRLQADNSQKDTRIRDLERQLAAKGTAPTAAGSGSSAEVATLKRQLEQASAQYSRTVDDLNRQLQARNQEVETAQAQAAQVDELNRRIDGLQSELAQAKVSATQVAAGKVSASELKKRDSQIASLQQETAKLRDELSKAQKSGQQSSKSSAEVALLTEENQALQREVDMLKSQTASASANVNQSGQLQERVASLQSELSDLRMKYDQAVREADDARKEAEAQKKLAAAAKAPAPAANAKGGMPAALQKQVSDLSRQLAALRQENASLKKQPAAANGAQTVYKAASANSPEAQKAYAEGKAALTAGDVEKALDRLNQAQLLEPDSSPIAIDYSVALAENQQYADAIEYLRRYLQRNPADREAYNQLGKIYLLNDQADAASQAFSRAISISMLNNYATSLKKQNRIDDAESIFKLALKLNPNDSEVLFNLGNLYNATNKLELARNNYLQALQIKPDFAEAHYNLGLIYSKLGNNTDAVSHLEKFLQLSPNARNAETIRSYVARLKT